jgi:hypothetical protein
MSTARAARLAGPALRTLAAAVGIFGPAAATMTSAEELAPFQASYAWSWHGTTVAISTLKLAHQDGDIWVYSSTSEPRGLGYLYPMRPALRSTLRITARGVQPLSFKADGSGANHDADVTFDWSAGRASGVYEGVPVDMPIKAGIQDDLSVQIAMMVELLHGRTPEQLSMIDKNSTREYRYQSEGTQAIATALGRIDTVIYSSQHPGSPRVTRFWCAPSMGYLPLRIEQKRIDNVEWSMDIRSVRRD